MTVALSPDLPPNLLSQLIVADIAPSKGALSPEFQAYVEAMKKIEESQVTTRKDAQQILSAYEPVRPTAVALIPIQPSISHIRTQ